MTRRPGRRITRRSAARGLDRTGSTGVPQVDDLLRAAAAPGSNAELNGEADMVALFRTSTPVEASPATVRMTLVQTTRARIAAAKVGIAATVSILLVGGVSYAAASGKLDDIVPGGSGDSSSHASTAPGQTKAPNPNKPTKGPKAPEPTEGPTATTAPSPSTVGNCTAYLAHKNENNPGKYLDSAAFQALIAKAGGKENLDAYCTGVVAVAKPTKKPHPTHPAKPTKKAKPTQAADPTQKAKPTKKPQPTQANNTKSPNPNKPTKTPRS